MAEGYMIALASQLGRDRAHEVLYEAVRRSREKDQPLVATLRSSLDAEAWSALEPVLPTPSDYLGSTTQICQAAVTEWRRGAQPDSTRTDPVVITEEEGNE